MCNLLQRTFASHSTLIRINFIEGRGIEVHPRLLGLRSFVREVLMKSFAPEFVLATGSTTSDVSRDWQLCWYGRSADKCLSHFVFAAT